MERSALSRIQSSATAEEMTQVTISLTSIAPERTHVASVIECHRGAPGEQVVRRLQPFNGAFVLAK